MKRLFILFAVALLGGCAARQPEPPVKPVPPENTGPLTLAELGALEQAYKMEVAKMSVPELCAEYRSQGSTKYRARFRDVIGAEFRKRNVWSKMEWELIKSHQIAVGVSENLVRCSWGDPVSVDTTRTSHVVYKKLVYGSSYVYIDNDIVTTIQSSSGSY